MGEREGDRIMKDPRAEAHGCPKHNSTTCRYTAHEAIGANRPGKSLKNGVCHNIKPYVKTQLIITCQINVAIYLICRLKSFLTLNCLCSKCLVLLVMRNILSSVWLVIPATQTCFLLYCSYNET